MHEGRSQEPSLLQGLVPEWVTQQGSADSNCELVWVQTCFPLPGWFTEHFGSPMAGETGKERHDPKDMPTQLSGARCPCVLQKHLYVSCLKPEEGFRVTCKIPPTVHPCIS